MIIDVKTPVADYRGQEIKDTGGTAILVGDVLFTAADSGGEQNDDNKAKLLRFRLSMRIVAALDGDGKVSLTSTEAALLMESVGRLYKPLVVGRISEILDGNAEQEG